MKIFKTFLFLPLVLCANLSHYHMVDNVPQNYQDLYDFVSKNDGMNDIDLIHNITAVPLDFKCPTNIDGRSKKTPTDVDDLRVGDIDIVAAMGDSITAGFAAEAKTLIGIVKESRGISWSIGGRDDVRTFPNIMKKYNPNLIGASIKTTIAHITEPDGYNVAVSGAIAEDMPGQATKLVEYLEDYDDEWKHITLFIGGNDLCAVCKGDQKHLPHAYAGYLEEALNVLVELPRTFISVVTMLDVTLLNEYATGLCPYLHVIECDCTTGRYGERSWVSEQAHHYQHLVHELVDAFPTRQDFSVVVQPFVENFEIPKDDDGPLREFLAPDCFHFSTLAHAAAAVSLWNNLIEPVNTKDTTWKIGEPIKCPTNDTRLQTKNNHKY